MEEERIRRSHATHRTGLIVLRRAREALGYIHRARISRATYTYVQNRRRARIRARANNRPLARNGALLVIVTVIVVIVAVPFARSVPAIADSARARPSLARSRATHVSFFFSLVSLACSLIFLMNT